MKVLNAAHYVQALFSLLKANRQEHLLPEILSKCEEKVLEKEQGVEAKLFVSVLENKEAMADLARRIKIPGIEKMRIISVVDKNLLGGFKLRVGDILIDASTKKKINDLKKILLNEYE